MARRARHLCPSHDQIVLSIALAPHRHVSKSAQSPAHTESIKPDFVNGLLCNVLNEAGKGAIEIALTQTVGVLAEEEEDLLALLLKESGRKVTFLALFQRGDLPEACPETRRRARAYPGAVPQTSPLALTRDINMRNPFSFAAFPCWSRVFADKSKAAQRAVYADPAFRNACRAEIKGNIDWRRLTVHETHKPELKRYEGRTVADVAAERGVDPIDGFLDLTVEDDLDIEFVLAQFNVNVELVKDNLVDPNVLIALGDGGAHVDMLCDAGYPTYLLGTWVRERQIMTLEQAVARLTAQPADLFGIKVRHQGPWPPRPRQCRRYRDLRSGTHRLGEPRRAPLRSA